MFLDIIYHPSEGIDNAIKILADNKIFFIVKIGSLPDTDGELWMMRLDVNQSVDWKEFREKVESFVEFCNKNAILCKIKISKG